MDNDLNSIKRDLKKLMESQPLAVLSTQNQGQPYASLVAFVCSNDLSRLYFATIRSTRKFANILSDSRVAMLVDNRSNKASDFDLATAATATGIAIEVDADKRQSIQDLYLNKHPDLKGFLESSACALCEIRIQSYFVVTRFQNVATVPIHIT